MKNRLHVYTGEGKGKTTAAMGLALRSLGHGNAVLIAQFMKDGRSGELEALKRFENARVLLAPPLKGFTFQMTPAQLADARAEQTAFAARLIRDIDALRPQTVILDELCVALSLDMLEEKTARSLVDRALAAGETAVTGRDAPAWLLERADYVSRVVSVKHPFDTEGLPGRPGVEW